MGEDFKDIREIGVLDGSIYLDQGGNNGVTVIRLRSNGTYSEPAYVEWPAVDALYAFTFAIESGY